MRTSPEGAAVRPTAFVIRTANRSILVRLRRNPSRGPAPPIVELPPRRATNGSGGASPSGSSFWLAALPPCVDLRASAVPFLAQEKRTADARGFTRIDRPQTVRREPGKAHLLARPSPLLDRPFLRALVALSFHSFVVSSHRLHATKCESRSPHLWSDEDTTFCSDSPNLSSRGEADQACDPPTTAYTLAAVKVFTTEPGRPVNRPVLRTPLDCDSRKASSHVLVSAATIAAGLRNT